MIYLLSLNFVAGEAVAGTVLRALQVFSKAVMVFVRACLEYLKPNLEVLYEPVSAILYYI